ncbi:AMED_5909 family protein [Amycolatopsis minnesotensis]
MPITLEAAARYSRERRPAHDAPVVDWIRHRKMQVELYKRVAEKDIENRKDALRLLATIKYTLEDMRERYARGQREWAS